MTTSAPPLPTAAPIPRFFSLFLIALAVRVGTVALGSALAARPPDPYTDPETPTVFRDELMSGPARVIEPWYRYDALWLANVARNGYRDAHDKGGHLGPAFFPALPMTMALADALGLNPFWFALIVTNIVGAAGAAVLARV